MSNIEINKVEINDSKLEIYYKGGGPIPPEKGNSYFMIYSYMAEQGSSGRFKDYRFKKPVLLTIHFILPIFTLDKV